MASAPSTPKAGWEVKTLGEVCAKITDGSHNPPKGIDGLSDFMMLSSKNVHDDEINLDKPRYLTESDFNQSMMKMVLPREMYPFGEIPNLAILDPEKRCECGIEYGYSHDQNGYDQVYATAARSPITQDTDGCHGESKEIAAAVSQEDPGWPSHTKIVRQEPQAAAHQRNGQKPHIRLSHLE